MSHSHTGISWNRQKRIYDGTMIAAVLATGAVFIGVSVAIHPASTIETLLLRTTSMLAFLLLHVVLCIGPLARLDARFTPLLYNRRHLGVMLFFLALAHGVLATIQFHALGDQNPLVSLFAAYGNDFWFHTSGLARVPFEPFGAFALMGLFILASSSHDFWLKNLGADVWKLLHVLVYPVYGLVLLHLFFGAFQKEQLTLLPVLTAAGFFAVLGVHFAAAYRDRVRLLSVSKVTEGGFLAVCPASQLVEGRGHTVQINGHRVALFLHQGKVFALSNVCRHQGGPIGEGRILDGCVTCPWHGWNYRVENGISPPPFDEVLPTYRARIRNGSVEVNPEAIAAAEKSSASPAPKAGV